MSRPRPVWILRLLALVLALAPASARPLDWQDHLEEGELLLLPTLRAFQDARPTLNCCGCEERVRDWEARMIRAATPASLHFAMAVRKARRGPAPDAFLYESYYYLATSRYHQRRAERAHAAAAQAVEVFARAQENGTWEPDPETLPKARSVSWLQRLEPTRAPRQPMERGEAYRDLRSLLEDMAVTWSKDTALTPLARGALELDVELTERVDGLDSPAHGEALRQLGLWLLRNDYVTREGLEPLHDSLALLERLEGTGHPDVVHFRGELAAELMRWARADQAASLYVSALERLFEDAVPEEQDFLRVIEDTVFHFCNESTAAQHERILNKALTLSDRTYGDTSEVSRRLLERMTGCYGQLREAARAAPYELRLRAFPEPTGTTEEPAEEAPVSIEDLGGPGDLRAVLDDAASEVR